MDRVSVIITAALLLLPAPASANVPVLCGFDNGDGTVAVGPCPETLPTDLGTDQQPWHVVKADEIEVAGQRGITQVIHVPGCTLTIQGGIIVAATPTSPFQQTCP
jgi:hypothetical protein